MSDPQSLPPHDGLADLLARLADLHGGDRVLHEVVRAGQSAVPGLRALVLEPPQPVFAHRCRAVDALAAIGTPGARSVLVDALEELAARTVPPSLQLAEDAVVNRIAEHLGRLQPDARVTGALLAALATRPLGEVARALGRPGEPGAVALLVGCLDDDMARNGASEALARIGAGAVEALAEKLASGAAPGGYEASHLVAARVAAARTLGIIATPEAKRALAGALHDPQPQVRSWAAVALIESGGPLREAAIPILLESLGQQSWLDAVLAIDTLAALGHHALHHLIAALEPPPAGESHDRRRERVLEVLARLGDARALPAIARLAGEATPSRTALAAVSALERLAVPGATGVIAAFLGHPSPAVRERAVHALARRGPAGAAALAAALGDRSRSLRRVLWQAFASMDAPSRSAFRRAALRSGSLPQRAAVLLRSIRPPRRRTDNTSREPRDAGPNDS